MSDSGVTRADAVVIHPVVLCGGSGTRLWPLSRKAFPKQFIPLVGEKSLLQLTLERVALLTGTGGEGITCVCSEDHRFLVADVAEQAGVVVRQILEPQPKNTAAAMALAVLAAPADALLLFCPADHHIPQTQAFVSMVHAAATAARSGQLVTFGVQPSMPSTAYGYIQKGQATGDGGSKVARFVEKPDVAKALGFLADGHYLWNAGIFLVCARTLLEALQAHAPDILDVCRAAMQQSQQDGLFTRPNAQAFAACRSQSIDYAVMEHAANVVVFPFDGVWSDVGSWNAVAELEPTDAQGNRTGGDTNNAHHLHSGNTYIYAGGKRPVVALGTQDLLIIDTPDALLVTHTGHAEAVREVVAKLESLDASQAMQHRRVARPWGWYDSVDVGRCHQVKRITVRPGASLSLQMHHHRAEHWIVVSGTAEVINGDKHLILVENQSTYIPLGQTHRLSNPGTVPLEIIEVQSGTYLGEDDIVRFEDTYGRN
ncbi:MAG: mannose-1-phosphate guanylyltransferase/mannose-6-phosphate isomerase [Polaromonas sp.]|nr:mannose-1-phosphate guanylyltransferase/mannose-6-phosphate isomerase [Polaromonas sp.]MDP3751393.1 mannose-1-phosphate guanylyltransferase/mannose-6-phosphate isomerase [Polaromonas sp.]